MMLLTRFARARSKASRRPQLEMLETRQVLSTLVVAPTGSDSNPGTAALPLKTLQHAADVAVAGDTVAVKAGNYTGFQIGWDTPKSGLPGKPITFSAEPGVVINVHNNKTQDGIDLEGASYITIQGFKVTGMGRADIRSVQNTGVVISNNTCDYGYRWGIFTSFSNNVRIENNLAERSVTEHGIYVSNTCSNPVVINNTLYQNAACGIQFNGDVSQGGAGVITNAVVTGNTLNNNGKLGGAAINCDGLQNSLIANNYLVNNRSTGIALFQGDAAMGSKNNIIANNSIAMTSTARWAININTGSTGNQVLNNILLDANTSRGSITITSDSLAGFVSDYNIVSQFNIDGSNLSLSAWRTATGQDSHSLTATTAQIFLSPSLSTPTLVANCVAVNGGTNLSKYFTTNIKGTPRPATGPWNIGCM